MKFSSKNIIFLINILLGGFVAYMLGALLSSWINNQMMSLPYLPSRSSEFEKQTILKDIGEPKQSFQEILERNIFNAQKTEIDTPVSVQEDDIILSKNIEGEDIKNSFTEDLETKHEEEIENTQLAIALAGTMIYSKKNSFAFISKKESLNKYVIFGIDECFHAKTIQREKNCLSDSVKVLQIKDRWVLILYQGKKQALRMVSSTPSDEDFAKIEEPRVNQNQKSIIKKLSPNTFPQKKKVVQKGGKKITDSLIKNGNTFHFKRVWVDEQLANFEQLLSDARVVPIKKDEKPYFMFQFIKEESIYEKLGLKKNDIILEINGFFVDSVGKALKLLEVLQSEREISLKVERGGEAVKFHYYIN